MTNAKLLIAAILALAACSFAEPLTNNKISVDRLYLKYKADDVSYNPQAGFSIINHPYFGYESNYIPERVSYFGRNIAKEMEQVPKAKNIMTGYMLHRIGLFVGILAGSGIIAATVSSEMNKDSRKNPDGTYSTKMPTGIKVGFGVMGLGLALELTKSFYLRAAINEYNKYAAN